MKYKFPVIAFAVIMLVAMVGHGADARTIVEKRIETDRIVCSDIVVWIKSFNA